MWKFLKLIFAKDTSTNQVKCPFCSYQDTAKEFISWERNGVQGLRGKLPNGDMVVACPQCLVELRYDVLSGKVVVFKL
jgi:hypothetical protein